MQLLPAVKLCRSMGHVCHLLLSVKSFFDQQMYLETRVTYVIEVTDFKSEVIFDLRGCLEAVEASEAAKRAHILEAICTWISR